MSRDASVEKEAARFQIPEKLKVILAKLPSPEAIEVLEEIHAQAQNNNNNNNNVDSQLENRFLDRISKMSSKQLLDILGP